MRHVAGLDAIRLACALIVAVGHFAPNLAGDLRSLGPLARPFAALAGLLFNGPAAVIVFFVLSGYVIHRPYALGRPFIVAEYLARRYVRIVPPAIAAGFIYVAVGVGPRDGDWNNTVMWSVFCELIYYTLYPLLPRGRANLGRLTVAAYVVSIGVSCAFPSIASPGSDYPAFGHWTWLIGLPCWLSGAWLAEADTTGRPAATSTWLWRGGVLLVAAILRGVKFHGLALGWLSVQTIHLTLFALLVTLWLRREVAFGRAGGTSKAGRWLDTLGQASFSIYLIHPVALRAAQQISADHGSVGLAVFLATTILAAIAFYVSVERPSHRLAQRLGRRAGLAQVPPAGAVAIISAG